MQGPRVALARSEMLGPGTWCEFRLTVFNDAIPEGALKDMLDYGQNKGMLQWRNSMYWGVFEYELREVSKRKAKK